MVLSFIVCCTIYFINIVQIVFHEKVFIILSQALQLYEKQSTLTSTFYGIKQICLSLFKQIFVRQEIQQPNSQHSEFVLLAVNIIANNDNLTEMVID